MEERVIRIIPYSYSSLTGFETCPRKHYGERLAKEFARRENKKADTGTAIHKQAEDYAIDGEEFDNPYGKQIREIVDTLQGKGGKFFAELELAVREDKTPCGWWDADCYTRAKLDICHMDDKEATIIDWKTGRPDPFSTQLKHSALLILLHYPEVDVVHTRYEWLKEGYATKGKIHREFLSEDWNKFEQRVAKYKNAKETNNWPAKKGFLCGKYCGIDTCEHYGKSAR